MSEHTTQHQHKAAHFPASGNGFAVCDCGATQFWVKGQPAPEGWHTCSACTAPWGLPQPKEATR